MFTCCEELQRVDQLATKMDSNGNDSSKNVSNREDKSK